MNWFAFWSGLGGAVVAMLAVGTLTALQPWAKWLWDIAQRRKEWERAKEQAENAKAEAEAAEKRAEAFAERLLERELAGIHRLQEEERAFRQRHIESAEREQRILSVLAGLQSVPAPGLHTLKASGAASLQSHEEFVEVVERQEASGIVSVLGGCEWLKQTPQAREIFKRLRTIPAMQDHNPEELEALRRELAPETLP